MNTVVIFTTNNVRIRFISDNEIDAWKDKSNILINPDLSNVAAIPPQYWKRVDDKILPMTTNERLARDVKLSTLGTDNHVTDPLSGWSGFFRRMISHTRRITRL